MTSEAWTPGPWRAAKSGRFRVYAPDGLGERSGPVAEALHRHDGQERAANRDLLAAAPTLAEALDAPEWGEIDDAITEWTDGKTSDLAALGRVARRFFKLDAGRRAALAKARGDG